MKVLVGCEESQAVCKAFRAKGHEAFSCDLQVPSGGHPEWHLQMDVFEAIKLQKWDLGIFFPECTHLAASGAVYWKEKQKDGRQQKAIQTVIDLWNSDIPKISIENPTGILSTVWRKPSQIIHPFYFGDPFLKRTCLWLKNLPPLVWHKTDTLFEPATAVKPEFHYTSNSYRSGARKDGTRNISKLPVYKPFDSMTDKRLRSKSFEGISKAMAEQWG
jgi:hypothetical protein